MGAGASAEAYRRPIQEELGQLQVPSDEKEAIGNALDSVLLYFVYKFFTVFRNVVVSSHLGRYAEEEGSSKVGELSIPVCKETKFYLKFGCLVKRGGRYHNWKKRWFLIEGHASRYAVTYFRDKKDAFSKRKPKGSICLKGCAVSSFDEAKCDFSKFGVALVPSNKRKRTWFLRAESRKEQEEWILSFRLAQHLANSQFDQKNFLSLAFYETLTAVQRWNDTRVVGNLWNEKEDLLRDAVLSLVDACLEEISPGSRTTFRTEALAEPVIHSICAKVWRSCKKSAMAGKATLDRSMARLQPALRGAVTTTQTMVQLQVYSVVQEDCRKFLELCGRDIVEVSFSKLLQAHLHFLAGMKRLLETVSARWRPRTGRATSAAAAARESLLQEAVCALLGSEGPLLRGRELLAEVAASCVDVVDRDIHWTSPLSVEASLLQSLHTLGLSALVALRDSMLGASATESFSFSTSVAAATPSGLTSSSSSAHLSGKTELPQEAGADRQGVIHSWEVYLPLINDSGVLIVRQLLHLLHSFAAKHVLYYNYEAIGASSVTAVVEKTPEQVAELFDPSTVVQELVGQGVQVETAEFLYSALHKRIRHCQAEPVLAGFDEHCRTELVAAVQKAAGSIPL